MFPELFSGNTFSHISGARENFIENICLAGEDLAILFGRKCRCRRKFFELHFDISLFYPIQFSFFRPFSSCLERDPPYTDDKFFGGGNLDGTLKTQFNER